MDRNPVWHLVELAAPGCVLFLLLPLGVYITNLNDVLATRDTIISVGLAASLVAFVVMRLAAIPLGMDRMARLCASLALGLAIITVFLPVHAEPLAGRAPATSPDLRTVTSCIQLAVILAAAYVLHRLRPDLTRILNLCILAVTFGLALWVAGFVHSENEIALAARQSNTERGMTLGHERNIIIALFDNVPGRAVERLFMTRPELRRGFEGFILYPNAACVAGSTYFTLPVIFSGDTAPLHAGDTVNAIFDAAYADSFFTDAPSHGYNPAGAFYASMPRTGIPFTSCLHWHEHDSTSLAPVYTYARHMSASLERIIPRYFLTSLREALRDMRQALRGESGRPEARARANRPRGVTAHDMDIMLKSRRAFVRWRDSLRVGTVPRKILFFHSLLTHSPYVFDEDGSILAEPDEDATLAYGLEMMRSLTRRLDELGVLDRSLVLYIADHGHGETNGGNFNPMFMVREPDARGELRMSEALVWQGDIRPGLNRFMRNPAQGMGIDEMTAGRNAVETTFYHVPTTGRFVPPSELGGMRLGFTGNHAAIQRTLDGRDTRRMNQESGSAK
ncbi:hypothetical protein GGQ74_000814 [Desulfobaculum xiamenense]|uniref:Sulfatase N-terminal domain-containing protein n=1 Tax=Desulfobaculum xiamenense TaxID=995050 RepID=A0A846QPN3_9BACT|nr:hypothetical protein [Desulfobaculum xiamenense]NJB67174.1 hypothetical protein [Desulfobaculum xiamenense]